MSLTFLACAKPFAQACFRILCSIVERNGQSVLIAAAGGPLLLLGNW
jgi:hypothetical protein